MQSYKNVEEVLAGTLQVLEETGGNKH